MENKIDSTPLILRQLKKTTETIHSEQETKRRNRITFDAPSCFVNHDIIQQKLREFVIKHFKKCITRHNFDSILQAWDEVSLLGTYSNNGFTTLSALNINDKQQQHFIEELTLEYGISIFIEHPEYKKFITNTLAIDPISQNHVVHLKELVDFDQLLDNLKRQMGY